MKKIFIVLSMGFIFASSLSLFPANARALDANTVWGQLKGELLNKGLAAVDINASAQPVKTMLGLGANSADMKSLLLEFAGKGFKGNDLGKLSTLVSELMKSGLPVKASETFVSNALQKARASGATGSGLIAKVQTLVNQKKEQLAQLKNIADQNAQDVNKAKKKLNSILGR